MVFSSIIHKICMNLLGPSLFNSLMKIFTFTGIGLYIVFLTSILMPYITTILIVYGFLTELRIFRYKNWINLALAISITSSVFFIPIPGIGYVLFFVFVNRIFSLLTHWSVLLFSFMFFVGTIYFYKMRVSKWQTSAGVYAAYRDEARSLRFELRSVNEALATAMQNLARETDPTKRASLEKSIQELSDRRNDISERIREMEEVRRRL
ncbi:MAG: hypothetical protein QXY45_03935 [Candidatus Aenigmatarchaeota archaeon]